MDDIYYELVTFDFPDSITGGLRRTTDALRAVLERTRADLTMTQSQRRLEAALNRTLAQTPLPLSPALENAEHQEPLLIPDLPSAED